LYMSMSANETELEIEDELAKGKGHLADWDTWSMN